MKARETGLRSGRRNGQHSRLPHHPPPRTPAGKKLRPAMMLLMAEAVNEHMEAVAAAATSVARAPEPAAAAAAVAPPPPPPLPRLLQRHDPRVSYRTDGLPQCWAHTAPASLLEGPVPAAESAALPPPPCLPAALALPLQQRLAEITEMIHTASLLHDDVVDGSDTRRGIPSASAVFGNKLAVLAGDFMLARASVCLARLRSIPVVEVISTIIEHLVKGEVMQMRRQGGPAAAGGVETDEQRSQAVFEQYLRKS